MHSIEFSFQTPFWNFFGFPTTICTHKKFNNIVHILDVKITKLLKIKLGEGFPVIPITPPNSNIVFNLDFSNNSMKKWFNDQ
jgi:hypothetical protein